jgi:phage-related baseplate assembly protein
VFLHVLAAGPDDIPVLPSTGLKQSLAQYFEDLKVLTDEIRVVDGAIKFVDIVANVIISRSADPSLVKIQMNDTINSFFDISNFDMGRALRISKLYEALQSIDGVSFVRLIEPANDIVASKEGAITAADDQVGFDELITLGNVNVKLYFESDM